MRLQWRQTHKLSVSTIASTLKQPEATAHKQISKVEIPKPSASRRPTLQTTYHPCQKRRLTYQNELQVWIALSFVHHFTQSLHANSGRRSTLGDKVRKALRRTGQEEAQNRDQVVLRMCLKRGSPISHNSFTFGYRLVQGFHASSRET